MICGATSDDTFWANHGENEMQILCFKYLFFDTLWWKGKNKNCVQRKSFALRKGQNDSDKNIYKQQTIIKAAQRLVIYSIYINKICLNGASL